VATLYTQQDKNVRKTWFLMTTFLIVIIGLGWSFSYIYQNQAILYIAVIFSLGMNIMGYWFSDSIVLKTAGAKPVSRESHRELWNILENLSITAGIKMPKLYIIEEAAPNAFATGRNYEHSAVAVTTGLIKILDRSEMEGVIAHELSHVKNRDTLVMTIVVVLVGFVTLLSDFFLRMSIYGNHGDNRDGRAQIIMIIAGFILALLAPVIAKIIQLAVSRRREFLADASGALLTRYPDGLASALQKISSSGIQMKRANHATAHLYISNPFKGKSAKSFLSRLYMTHPPVEERVKALIGK